MRVARHARHAGVLGAVLVVAAAGAGAAAVAQSGEPRSFVVRDARSDVRSSLDLTRMSLARGSDGLRASITLAAPWDGEALLAADGPPGSICLKLWTHSDPPDQPADYLVCVTAAKDAALRGTVLRERANQLPANAGKATLSRPSERTVTLRFSQTSIGRPADVDVAAETTRPGCPRGSCIDLAPDAPKTGRVHLRKQATAGPA
jgi:hypothetical protein